MRNRAFFRTIRVRDRAITDFTYDEPFACEDSSSAVVKDQVQLCTASAGADPESITRSTTLDGGPKGIRTPDLLAASQALYQLSYGPGREAVYRVGGGSLRQVARLSALVARPMRHPPAPTYHRMHGAGAGSAHPPEVTR